MELRWGLGGMFVLVAAGAAFAGACGDDGGESSTAAGGGGLTSSSASTSAGGAGTTSSSGSAGSSSATTGSGGGPPVEAPCVATGTTVTAASTSRADVLAAIDAAADGDSVEVPAGSSTWSSNIDVTKNIKIVGAGQGSTTITGAFNLTGSSARICGFTFNLDSTYFTIDSSVGFRIDHNTMERTTWDLSILAYGNTSTGVEGLIDNNLVTYGRIVYYGEPYGGSSGNARWAEPIDLGTDHALYVEDNDFNFPDGSSGGSYGNSVDGNLGSRFVVRFNRWVGSRIEQHSLQGDNQRAVRIWEIYHNSMTNPATPNYRPYFIRGGTGVIFHNTSDGQFLNNVISIDNARSSQASIASQIQMFGFCDGASSIDANTNGQVGWPCRDQIGRSTDASLWMNYSDPGPSQASQPAYIWRNTQPDEMPVVLNCENSGDQYCNNQTKHLVESRDFYTYRSSFDGSAGVGEGPLASRPSTCTAGAGYWATDDGEWNSAQPGPDGQLYTCTAPNTWSVYYKPYPYPHPRRSQ